MPTKSVRPNNNDIEFNLGGHFWWAVYIYYLFYKLFFKLFLYINIFLIFKL